MKSIEVKIDQIEVVEGRNPRLVLLGIEDLMGSIHEHGVMTPIKVQRDGMAKYRLIDGHRRLEACRKINENMPDSAITHIPAIVLSGLETEADVLIQMMVANDSVPFTPVEEAMMLKRLQDEFGLTVQMLATKVGKSPSLVSDRLALLRAHPDLREAVESGDINPADANTIVRKSRGDTEQQAELTKRVLEEGREIVIERELKRGRLPKVAWDHGAVVHDLVFQSVTALPVEVDNKAELLKDLVKANNPVEALSVIAAMTTDMNAVLEVMYSLGQLQTLATLANLPDHELWDKIAERNNF